jgi:hypothetical protein
MKISDLNKNFIQIACAVVTFCAIMILSVYLSRSSAYTQEMIEAKKANALLRSEIATLAAINNALEDHFDCAEIRTLLGIDGEVNAKRRKAQSPDRAFKAG